MVCLLRIVLGEVLWIHVSECSAEGRGYSLPTSGGRMMEALEVLAETHPVRK